MEKRYTVDELSRMNDEKLMDILSRSTKNDLNAMFDKYGNGNDINPSFIQECFKKVRDKDKSWYLLTGTLSVELSLPESPTWDDVYEYADTYMNEIDSIGKSIGYNSSMLINYLKEHFHAPVPK